MPTVRPGQVLPYGAACAPAPREVRRSVGVFEAALGRRSPSLPLLSLALLAACLIAMGLAPCADAGRVRQPDQDKPSSSWGEVTSACGPARHYSRLFQNEKTNRGLPPTTSTDEFKASAVRLVLDEGESVSATARDLDLTASALQAWVTQARADRSKGKTGLTTAERVELAKLHKQVRELRMGRQSLENPRPATTGNEAKRHLTPHPARSRELPPPLLETELEAVVPDPA